MGFPGWHLAVGGAAAAAFVFGMAACATGASGEFVEEPSTEGPDGGNPNGVFPGNRRPGCEGSLSCFQVDCGGTVKTTLTGKVFAPNGTLPLYNAIVYVPDAPLEPLVDGVTCDRCGTVSGKPLVTTLTNPDGTFELRDIPVVDKLPLVIQIGKWRRSVELDFPIQACQPNNVADTNLTRLPRNRFEGDIPRIAVTTGWCDQLACLLPKLGLDSSEFTPDSDPAGRLHVFRGAAHSQSGAGGPAPAPSSSRDAAQLYNKDTLGRYDMLLLSCECDENDEQDKPQAAKDAMYDYASGGGRIFASHFHHTWRVGTPLNSVAQWSLSSQETAMPPYLINTDFAKGKAFADWLQFVGASPSYGVLPIAQPRENVLGVNAGAQQWAYRNNGATRMTKYLSANTPVGETPENQCGKFVFADMHLYSGDEQFNEPGPDLPDNNFPSSCSKELTPEEKALVFLFFDLASCIQDEGRPPRPPLN